MKEKLVPVETEKTGRAGRTALLQLLQILPLHSLAVWPHSSDLCFIKCVWVGQNNLVWYSLQSCRKILKRAVPCEPHMATKILSLFWRAWWRKWATAFFFMLLIPRPTGTWAEQTIHLCKSFMSTRILFPEIGLELKFYLEASMV